MAKLATAWLRFQIRCIKPVLSRLEVKNSRIAQDRLGELYSKSLAQRVLYTPVEGYEQTVATWALPRGEAPQGVILYLHGGGYVAGSLQYSRLFGGVLASKCKQRVFCLAYSLAPEHPFPAALNDAYHAYSYLLASGITPQEISFIGESAGGGLLFCLMHKLKEEKMPLPACVVSISPWMDLTMSGASHSYNAKNDITLSGPQLQNYAHFYAPYDRENKFVSPVFGEFSGFPPALVFAGGHEIVVDDARLAETRYQEAGGDCRLVVEPGMWHAYPLYPTRESKVALNMINDFLLRHFPEKAEE